MNKLLVIIFSYNRAMQLDALLKSINKYLAIGGQYEVAVLYNYSNPDFGYGYDIVRKIANVRFFKESLNEPDRYLFREFIIPSNFNMLRKFRYLRHPKTNFRSLLIQILRDSDAQCVMFLTDDSIFVRDVIIDGELLEWITKDGPNHQFSFRLGHGMNNQPPETKESDSIINWDFYECPKDSNWGYPFSVDGHIYKKEEIIKLFQKYIFVNPNTLESNICAQTRKHHLFSKGRCNEKASLLSFPINMVQAVADNERLNMSPELMNRYFLKGYRLEYPIPDIFNTFQQYPDRVFFCKGNERIGVSTK